MTIICSLARVRATLSFRSISCPFSSNVLQRNCNWKGVLTQQENIITSLCPPWKRSTVSIVTDRSSVIPVFPSSFFIVAI